MTEWGKTEWTVRFDRTLIFFMVLTLLWAPRLSAQTTPLVRVVATGASGSLDALEEVVELDTAGMAVASIQVTGTFVATVAFEISNDDTNWVSITCETATPSTGGTTGANTTGIWLCPVAGVLQFRGRVAAYTSGTVGLSLAGSAGGGNFPSPLIVSAVQNGAWTMNAVITNSPEVIVGNLAPSSSSTYALTSCHHVTTASTNSINCADAVANFYGFRAVNTTTTIAYLRLYNLASAPTCSSATGFIESIPIPPAAAAGQAGGIVAFEISPTNYTTGIGFCVTGGGTSTDNTNAPAGIYIKARYKE